MSQDMDHHHIEKSLNNRLRKSTEFQGIVEPRKSFSHTKPMLGLPVEKKPPIDLGVRPNVKNLINKFTINADRQIEIVVDNPLQSDTFREPIIENKQEEPKVDKVEEPIIESKQEEPKVEETKVEETKVEEVVIDIPPLIPKLDLENVKKEEEERQNKSSKRKSSNKKPSTPTAVFIFKDDDDEI
jgi:hypothetical protein